MGKPDALQEEMGARVRSMIEAALYLEEIVGAVLGNESSGVRAKILKLWAQTLRTVRADVYPEAQHVEDLIEWLMLVAGAL